jgi:hypothetical protein
MKCAYDGRSCQACIARCQYLIEVSEAFKVHRPIPLKNRKSIVDRIRRQLTLFSPRTH